MHGRVVGAAIALVVLLAVPAVASATTKTVQAGPPGSQTAQFQQAFGDANNFFRKVTTIHKGDSVKWKINGFHNVLFPKAGVEVPAADLPRPVEPGQRRARREHPAPAVLVQRPAEPVDQPGRRGAEGRQDLQAGQALQLRPAARGGAAAPYKLKFKKTGSFSYFCVVHPGMSGTIKVVKKSKEIPSGKEDKKARNKEIAREARSGRPAHHRREPVADEHDPGGQRPPLGRHHLQVLPGRLEHQGRDDPDAADAAQHDRGPHVHVRADERPGRLRRPARSEPGRTGDRPPGRVPERSAARRYPALHRDQPRDGFLNTGFLAGGDPVQLPTSRKVTFSTPGTYNYICLIHPFMTGGSRSRRSAVGGGAVRGPAPGSLVALRHNLGVPDLLPGAQIAGCRIEAVAGRGGMGIVYRATQLSLGRPVAVKLIAPERAGDPGFRERFERESRVAAAIDHPNVIPVYAAGEEGGHLYLVMRYVAGTDLQGLLARERRLPPARVAGIGSRSAPRSTPRTPSGSCTATSSRPTSCSTASTPTSPTSGSPR